MGEQHPDIAVGLHNLGTILIKQKNYVEAEPVLREAVEIVRAASRREEQKKPVQPYPLAALAVVLLELDQPTESLHLISEALAAFENQLPEDHPRVVLAKATLGRVLAKTGKLSGSLSCLQEALNVMENHPDHFSQETRQQTAESLAKVTRQHPTGLAHMACARQSN